MYILVIVDARIFAYMCDYLNHLKKHLETNFNIIFQIYQYKDANIPLNVISGINKVIFIQRIVPFIYNKISMYYNGKVQMYLLNTEQSTHNNYNVFQHLDTCPVEIIDYSLENLVIIKKQFPNIKTWHFPFPIFIQKHKIRLSKKEYDIVSLNNSVYRNNVLCNIKYKDFNGLWGKERDHIIEKSRIMLNIHYNNDYNIFESIRCYHAFENGCLIVSQDSENPNLILLKECFFIEKLPNLINCVNNVLQDYENIFNDIFSDNNIDKINTFFVDYYKLTLLEMGIITNDDHSIFQQCPFVIDQ